MTQEIKIVLGCLFGDEGKGNTVQLLCRRALSEHKSVAVVRFSGGAQAGHRVVNNGIEHICSSFGSGSLLGVPTIYLDTANVLVDPIALVNEYNELVEKGIKVPMPDVEFEEIRVTTPYDVLDNRKDATTLEEGSCGKGIWSTIRRYHELYKKDPYLYPICWDENIDLAESFYGVKVQQMHEDYCNSCKTIINKRPRQYLNDFDVLIFEGTQGLLLDADKGFNPHTTPTKVGLDAIPKKYLTENTDVYLVTRNYVTRHGNGYDPKYPIDNPFPEPTNLDTGYQGKFKCGKFDPILFQRAIDRHCLDNYPVKYHWVITHMDDQLGKNPRKVLDMDVKSILPNLSINFSSILYVGSEDGIKNIEETLQLRLLE